MTRRSKRDTAGARMSNAPSGKLLSFFVPGRTHSRHVVLRDKEHIVARRHGSLMRSGQELLPDETILCATAWMHGVFGAQLTIGNTSFHKLFSVSRDPYNITRASGLRMLMETKDGWRLLTVPSAFEMGLSDCRWVYRLGQRTVTVSATVSGDEPAMQWRVTVEGPRCRFLVFGHLVLGEQEFGHAGRIEIELEAKALHFPAGPQRSLGPAISGGCLSLGDEHARAGRGHRRRRTSLCRRQARQPADTSRSARGQRTNSCSRSSAP